MVLPIGISFFTFQAISYMIDVYRGDRRRRTSLDFAVFMSFFPHLVAGPIVRASEFLPQLARRGIRAPCSRGPRPVPDRRRADQEDGGRRPAGAPHRRSGVQTTRPLHSGAESLLAIYGYAVQIYCDFSGYTDIAIGVALLLGFELPAELRPPVPRHEPADFWRRWHMTLSRWLRDYLYIPLGGNRGGRRARRTAT